MCSGVFPSSQYALFLQGRTLSSPVEVWIMSVGFCLRGGRYSREMPSCRVLAVYCCKVRQQTTAATCFLLVEVRPKHSPLPKTFHVLCWSRTITIADVAQSFAIAPTACHVSFTLRFSEPRAMETYSMVVFTLCVSCVSDSLRFLLVRFLEPRARAVGSP